jgi:hypothetical protein
VRDSEERANIEELGARWGSECTGYESMMMIYHLISLVAIFSSSKAFTTHPSNEFLAGVFEGKGNVAVNSKGSGLIVTLSRANDIEAKTPPKILVYAQNVLGTSEPKALPIKANSVKQGYQLSIAAKSAQRELFSLVLPHLQTKRTLVETSLEFIDLDSRERDGKALLAQRIRDIKKSRAEGLDVVDPQSISSSFVSGLVQSGVGSLEYYDGCLRFAVNSAPMGMLFDQVWQYVPNSDGKSYLNGRTGEFVLRGSNVYVFLSWIRDGMLDGDTRTMKVDVLINLHEVWSRPRFAPLSPEEEVQRQALAKQLRQ